VYFYMRREQLDSIQNMIQLIAQMYQHMPQAKLLAELFDQLSHDVLAVYYTGQTEKLLEQVCEEFKEMELPATREEFEIRSALLQLTHELYQFLKIAKKDKAPTPVKH
jgi:uncharacterized membrane protein YgaE (UPF0421/DUF939 family)